MRWLPRIPATIAVSALVHAALFAWVRTVERAPRPAVVEEPLAIIELVPVPDDPWEASAQLATELAIPALGPPAAPPRPAATAPARPAAPPAGTVAIATTTGTGATGTELREREPAGPRSRYFDMRRGARPDLSIPHGRWDALDHVPAGTNAEREEAPTGQLQPDGGGTHRSDQGPFTAKIAKDGSVTLKDKRNLNARIALPSLAELGDLVQAWYDDPNKPVGFLPPEKITKEPRIDRDAIAISDRMTGDEKAVYGEDRGPTPSDGDGGVSIPILAGGFDLSDALMRRRGIDPYASKKLAFLDSTRAERVQIGRKHRSEQLSHVAQIVQQNLARLWTTVADPAARKQALFELWDECVETGGDEVVTASREARALVIGFVRARFPAGSAHAYTAAELAALNRARQSAAMFAPYE